MSHPPFTTVAVLLFDGAALFESSVPISVFGMIRPGAPRFEVLVASETEAGILGTTAGVGLAAPHGLAALAEADVVIVPTFLDTPGATVSPAVCQGLREAHAGGAVIVGLCLGAFVLAEAGLLDGRPATTHWHLAPELARRYPAVEVRESDLYIDDGDVLTSAGSAAGLDLCLHLVRRSFGAEAAAGIARAMVVAPHRPGGQAQYISRPMVPIDQPDLLSEALSWAVDHLEEPLTADDLAKRSAMSRRTSDRHFRAATGTTPARWLLHHRLLQAQELLESTDLPVEDISRRSGFASPVSFRQQFRARFRVSPSAYRAAFTRTAMA